MGRGCGCCRRQAVRIPSGVDVFVHGFPCFQQPHGKGRSIAAVLLLLSKMLLLLSVILLLLSVILLLLSVILLLLSVTLLLLSVILLFLRDLAGDFDLAVE